MKQTPRKSLWRGFRWFFLLGCSCLWVLVVSFTARDFIASKDGNQYFYQSSKSYSLQTSITSNSREDCRGGNITATTQKTYETTNEDEIRALFDRWNDALLKGDPGVVADLYYDDEAKKKDSKYLLLLPTLSNEPRKNLESVEDYFVGFLKRKPRGRIVSGQILIDPDGSWAHDAGIYEFVLQNIPSDKNEGEAARASNNDNANPTDGSLKDSSSENIIESNSSVVRARYSFFYLRDGRGEWKIAHHHSSLMPEND